MPEIPQPNEDQKRDETAKKPFSFSPGPDGDLVHDGCGGIVLSSRYEIFCLKCRPDLLDPEGGLSRDLFDRLINEARESAYRAGREDAARRVLDPLLRLRDVAETDKRGREQDGDGEGVMCCVQYLDGLNIAINLLSHQLGEDQDTPEGRDG